MLPGKGFLTVFWIFWISTFSAGFGVSTREGGPKRLWNESSSFLFPCNFSVCGCSSPSSKLEASLYCFLGLSPESEVTLLEQLKLKKLKKKQLFYFTHSNLSSSESRLISNCLILSSIVVSLANCTLVVPTLARYIAQCPMLHWLCGYTGVWSQLYRGCHIGSESRVSGGSHKSIEWFTNVNKFIFLSFLKFTF